MDRPRRGWWGYVKWVIRDQPEKRRELEAMRSAGGFASDGTPRSTEARRTTEDRALRGFSGWKAREYDAVERAVLETTSLPDGAERLRLIDMLFWRQTHTLHGAAYELHIGYRTARRWQARFVVRVAEQLGFTEGEYAKEKAENIATAHTGEQKRR